MTKRHDAAEVMPQPDGHALGKSVKAATGEDQDVLLTLLQMPQVGARLINGAFCSYGQRGRDESLS